MNLFIKKLIQMEDDSITIHKLSQFKKETKGKEGGQGGKIIPYSTDFNTYFQRGSRVDILTKDNHSSDVSIIFTSKINHFNAYQINPKTNRIELIFSGIFKLSQDLREKIKEMELSFLRATRNKIAGIIQFTLYGKLDPTRFKHHQFSFDFHSAIKTKIVILEIENVIKEPKEIESMRVVENENGELKATKTFRMKSHPILIKSLSKHKLVKTLFTITGGSKSPKQNQLEFVAKINSILSTSSSGVARARDTGFHVFQKNIKENPNRAKQLEEEKSKIKIPQLRKGIKFFSGFLEGRPEFDCMGLAAKTNFLAIYNFQTELIGLSLVDLSTRRILKSTMISCIELWRGLGLETQVRISKSSAFYCFKLNRLYLTLAVYLTSHAYHLSDYYSQTSIGTQKTQKEIGNGDHLLVSIDNVFWPEKRAISYKHLPRIRSPHLMTRMDDKTIASIFEAENYLHLSQIDESTGQEEEYLISKKWKNFSIKDHEVDCNHLMIGSINNLKRIDEKRLLLTTQRKIYIIDLESNEIDLNGFRITNTAFSSSKNCHRSQNYFFLKNSIGLTLEVFKIDLEKGVQFKSDILIQSLLPQYEIKRILSVKWFQVLPNGDLLIILLLDKVRTEVSPELTLGWV